METNHLKDDLAHLQPLLASLARLVATGSSVRSAELETLLVAVDIDFFEDALAELLRWETLLRRLRQDPLPQQGQATVEALRLRGLEESAATLAVNLILDAVRLSTDREDRRGQLVVNPDHLRWDSLAPGQAAIAEIEIRGGPGHIEAKSDQIQVVPQRFAEGITRLSIKIDPLDGGTFWSSLRISTENGFFDVPILAQWSQNSTNLPESAKEEVHLASTIGKARWDLANAVSECVAGGVIHLLPGTYQLERGLYIEKGLALIGSGKDDTFLIGNAPDFVFSFGGPTDTVVSLRDLTIRYEGSSGADVILCRQGLIHIQNCRIEGAVEGTKNGGVGIRLCGTAEGDIEDCMLRSNQVAGIVAAENTRLMASNCLLCENGHGISVSDTATSQLINNTCEHNRHCGIVFSGQSSGNALNNECTANGADGIRVSGQSAPLLKQNTCRMNGKDGIVYYDRSKGSAYDNICSENQANGISVRLGARPILERNGCFKNLRLQINNQRK